MSASSVGEAKAKIGQAADYSQKARDSVEAAIAPLEEATTLVVNAAGDVSHEHIQDALQKFASAKDALIEAERLIKEAQQAADAYAEVLN